MKKFFSLLLASLFALVSLAQEKIVYDAHAEKREVNSFHAIKVSHGIELLINQGNEEALAVSAEQKEYRDAVKTEVVDGELRIYIKQDLEKWWNQLRQKGKKVKVYVSFEMLNRFDGSSGAKTIIEGTFTTNSLSIDLSSGASLKGKLKGDKVDVDVSSGAATNIGGEVKNLKVSTSSGAHFYGYELAAYNCKANASSGGKIELSVNKEITASASSGGGINYKGEASSTNITMSSGGKVRRGS